MLGEGNESVLALVPAAISEPDEDEAGLAMLPGSAITTVGVIWAISCEDENEMRLYGYCFFEPKWVLYNIMCYIEMS